MTEVLTGQEIETNISGRQVHEAYTNFTEQAQTGFKTEAQRLASYARLMTVTSDFFRQPSVSQVDSPQGKEAQEMIQELFVNQESAGDVTIDFFAATGQELNKLKGVKPVKVANSEWGLVNKWRERKQAKRPAAQWDHLLRFVNERLRAEALAVDRAAGEEVEALQTVRSLAERAEGEPDTEAADRHAEQSKQIKGVILGALAKDRVGGDEIRRIQAYAETIGELQAMDETPSAEVLGNRLDPYRSLMGEVDGTPVLDDLTTRAAVGHGKYVGRRLEALSTAASSADFQWEAAVKQGLIPGELFHSFEQIQSFVAIYELSAGFEGLSQEEKARQLLPFAEHGISATLLQDLVEDRFELTDDFIEQQVESFLDFYSEYDRLAAPDKRGRFIRTKKAAAALMATTLLGLPIASSVQSISEQLAVQSALNSAEQIKEDIPQEELDELTGPGKPTAPSPAEIGADAGAGAGAGASAEEVSTRVRTATNTSPEVFKEALEDVQWHLEGQNQDELYGLYRSSTASEFVASQLGWNDTKTVSKGSVPLQREANDLDNIATITAEERIIGSTIFELITKEDYAIVQDSIQIAGADVNYSLQQATDGTYFLEFSQEDVGKTINLTYQVGEADVINIPPPSAQELQDMQVPYITINQLPEGELKYLMQELAQSDEDPAIKAKIIEQYVKENFLYSLDPAASDMYLNQPNARSYFAKIAEVQRGDCDVVNGLYAMLLRSQDIPSRMVYGNLHTENGVLTSSVFDVTAASNHGWVEAYINGKWIPFDATPENFDEFTRGQLQDVLQQSRAGESEGERKTYDGTDRLGDLLEEDFFRQSQEEFDAIYENRIDPSTQQLINFLILAGIANATGTAITTLARRRNRKLVDQIRGDIDRRFFDNVQGKVSDEVIDTLFRSYDIKVYMPEESGDTSTKRRWLISPVPLKGIIDAFTSLAHTVRLRKKVKERIPVGSEQPEDFDVTTPEGFLVALGNKPEHVKRQLIEKGYRAVLTDIMNAEMKPFEGSGHLVLADYNYFRPLLDQTLDDMQEPKTEADIAVWERQKQEIMDRLYEATAFTGSVRHRGRKTILGQAEVMEGFSRMDRALFEKHMQELFRLRLIRWSAAHEYAKAKASMEEVKTEAV